MMVKSIIILFLLVNEYTKYCLSSYSYWDYDYQTEWAEDYLMCGASDQSPINIQTSQTENGLLINKCHYLFNWDIDFTKTTFKISNNGKALSLKAAEQFVIDPDQYLYSSLMTADGDTYITLDLNENTIATFPNYFKPLGSEHDTFCLDSIHFHWGINDWTGSEHLINDYQYPLEAHFVHYSCNHTSLGSTLDNFGTEDDIAQQKANGEDVHQISFVAIMFEVVDDDNGGNPAFDRIFGGRHLNNVKYPNDIPEIQPAEIVQDLDLNDLIPDDIETAGYYAYQGSFTTPPCIDIVRWFVMNAKGYIGRSQLAQFRELMSDTNHTIAPNFREPQENENIVYSCIPSETTTATTATTITTTATTTTTTTSSTISLLVYGIPILISCIALFGVVIVFILRYLKKDTSSTKSPSINADANNIEIIYIKSDGAQKKRK